MSSSLASAPEPQIAQPLETTPLSKPAIPRESLFKNRLQEYAQKAAIPLPSYHTINEGSSHAPQFRSKVVLDGATYTSPNVFSHRKAAEMDVAEIALLSLAPNMRFLSSDHSRPQIREESCSLDQEDTISCKQVLNEFAVKINVQNPIYITEKADGPQPMFVSSLTFNGKHYVGDKGRNKKESQQLVARTVILSILDSDAHTVISKIINSKKMLSAAKKKDKVPVGMQTESAVGISASKQNGLNVVMVDDNMPRTAIPEPCTGNSSNVAAKFVSLHQFRVPKKEALPDKGNATPIIFVPPECEQLVASTSVKKRKRKPTKAKNEVGIDAQVQISALPASETTCTVSQSVPNNCVSLQVCLVVTFLCASHDFMGSQRGKRELKTVRLGGGEEKKGLSKLQSNISSKALLVVNMVSWRKTQDRREEERQQENLLCDDDQEEEAALWKRTIIMGEKCRPLEFSGKITYDSHGNPVLDPKSRGSKNTIGK